MNENYRFSEIATLRVAWGLKLGASSVIQTLGGKGFPTESEAGVEGGLGPSADR